MRSYENRVATGERSRPRALRLKSVIALCGVMGVAAYAHSGAVGAEPGSEPPPRESRANAGKNASPAASKAASVLKAIRDTALGAASGHEALGLEGMANHMDPYLLGMVQMIRAIDESMFPALQRELERDICGDPAKDGIELILLAKLTLIESRMGSQRALNCAIERHPAEDAVLWALLDAWDVSGRPQLPALDAIARDARDERTRNRLLAPRARRTASKSGVLIQQ